MEEPLELQPGIIYGPVDSRRLGRSLGLNIMPTAYKVCSFNCIYCHYSWTSYLKTDLAAHAGDLPDPGGVERELEAALRTIPPPEYITFSGNGEATLHPQFPAIVDRVLAVRDRLGSAARVAILSNSTGLASREVRAALQKLDVRIMKLDAGTPEVLKRINRPAEGVTLEGILEGLAKLHDVTLQSAFVDGEVTNATESDIEAWLADVEKLKPRFVQVYSLENAPAMSTLVGVARNRLEEIVRRLRRRGISGQAY